MGLLQKACETYEWHSDRVGVIYEGREPLAPMSHMITNSNIEITIDQNGRFQHAAEVEKTDSKIIIPVTEDSAGRTSAPCPHPLCEQLCYLASYDEKKHSLYTEQLERWTNSSFSHPKLKPVLEYIKKGTILQDLSASGVIKLDETGKPEKEKLLVRWVVNGLGEAVSGPCWTDQFLFQAFEEYYASLQNLRKDAKNICMISGKEDVSAKQHPKGIVSFFGNAKLISANDTSGFTYRGRFREDWQAGTVSYEASQKAHSALRWLASNQGVYIGERIFLCWNPKGNYVPDPWNPLPLDQSKPISNPSEYKEALEKTLYSYQYKLPEDSGDVIIAAFDAATTGRLSVTYYNELRGSDFLQRLHDWDSICCWYNGPFGVQSPSLKTIVESAFGTQRTELNRTVLRADERVMKQQLQRLLACRVDQAGIPSDIEKLLVERASNPMAYDRSVYAKLLWTACAVVRMYHSRKGKKEVWEMSLDKGKHDRSYQFGRLLAVMEKIERDTYQEEERREPNAIRLQSVFCQRPMHIARTVNDQLKRAYLPRLHPVSRTVYNKLIGEIMEQINEFDEAEWNKPLKDTYLMGYYLQRNELYKSKAEGETAKNDEEVE
ncbi:MAG: type I-C CRISPR-associated protein Cas8c/Csd1 [Anaerovoracaceae bacterium]